MAGRDVSQTKSVDQWRFQENYVERLMDNSAFTAAHPNNTLLMAGPARFTNTASAKDSPGETLLPIGMVQNMSVQQQRPVQPMQAVGSSRSFFVAGKSSISFNMSRLMVNGRNLLRALYTQAVQSKIDVSKFDEPPVRSDGNEKFFLNLDSELFYIPIGLAVLFRSVSHDTVGAFYIELAMLNSWSVQFSAGQAMVMENVSGLADRIKPIYPSSLPGDSDAPSSTKIIEDVLKQKTPPTPDADSR